MVIRQVWGKSKFVTREPSKLAKRPNTHKFVAHIINPRGNHTIRLCHWFSMATPFASKQQLEIHLFSYLQLVRLMMSRINLHVQDESTTLWGWWCPGWIYNHCFCNVICLLQGLQKKISWVGDQATADWARAPWLATLILDWHELDRLWNQVSRLPFTGPILRDYLENMPILGVGHPPLPNNQITAKMMLTL
jgi:hypothetical protein